MKFFVEKHVRRRRASSFTASIATANRGAAQERLDNVTRSDFSEGVLDGSGIVGNLIRDQTR